MYVVTERIINGTVTIKVDCVIIDASDFNKAKEILKALPTLQSIGTRVVEFFEDTDEVFSYSILETDKSRPEFYGLSIYGNMYNKEATILREVNE